MPGTTPRGYDYPLYGETQSFPAQIQALATDIDTDVDSLYDATAAAYNAPTAQAYYAGLLSIPTDVDTTIAFNNEGYDNASMIDLGTAPTDISIPQVGLYVVTAWVEFSQAISPTNEAAMFIRSAGGLIPDIATVTKGLGSPNTRISMAALTRCASTAENITLVVRHNVGAPADIQFAYLNVTKVAP